jgi:hypothetical protein
MKIQVNHEGLLLSVTNQVLVYAAHVNVLGETLNTINKNM